MNNNNQFVFVDDFVSKDFIKQKHNFEIKDIYPNPAESYFTFTFISGKDKEKSKLMVSVCYPGGISLIQKEFENLTPLYAKHNKNR